MEKVEDINRYFYYDDVKQKILEFEKILTNSIFIKEELKKVDSLEIKEDMEIHNNTYERLLRDYIKIFGDFK